jgi:hypothetical protein
MAFHICGKVNQPVVLVWGTESPRVIIEDDRDTHNCVLCGFEGKCLWINTPPPPFWGQGADNTITGNTYLDIPTWPLPHSSNKMKCFLTCIWLFRTTWIHFALRWFSWAGVSDVWCRSPDLAPCNFLFGWLHKIHSVFPERLSELR